MCRNINISYSFREIQWIQIGWVLNTINTLYLWQAIRLRCYSIVFEGIRRAQCLIKVWFRLHDYELRIERSNRYRRKRRENKGKVGV